MKPIDIIKGGIRNSDLAVGTTLTILLINAFVNLPHTFLPVLLILAWLALLLLKPEAKKAATAWMRRHITPARVLAAFTLLILIVFFIKFNFKTWNMVILNDDHTPGYASSVRYLETLKQGGLYGWDSKILGGFCTVTEMSTNKSLVLFPFAAVFGPAVGYHFMILLFYLAFPYLCFWYTAAAFKNNKLASIVFAFASVFLITFFRNFMAFGMVDDLLGLCFFVLSMALYEKLKAGRQYAGFLLCLSLFFSMYCHFGFLFYSIVFITLELAFHFSRRLLFSTAVIFGLSFLMTLHTPLLFLWFFDSFHTDPNHYLAQATGILPAFREMARFFGGILDIRKSFTAGLNLEFLFVPLLPIFAYLWFTGNTQTRKLALYACLAVFIESLRSFPVVGMLAGRANYTLAFFYSVLLGLLIITQFRRGTLHGLILLPLFLVPTYKTNTYYSFNHIESLKKAVPSLVDAIQQLDGNMIWLESISHINAYTDGPATGRSEWPAVPTHWESLLAMETGKRFLTNAQELWSFVGSRDAQIVAGAFHGRPIEEFPIMEINAVAKKWGVKYVVVWTKKSMAYFSAASDSYAVRWAGSGFCIFEFLQADPRSVAAPEGQGFVTDHDYFGKTVSFTNVKAGDTAVIRQNYFPAWTGEYKGKSIPVLNRDGQMAVIIPESGNIILNLNFPRYAIVTAIALSALLISFLIFVAVPLIQRMRMTVSKKAYQTPVKNFT